MKKIIFIIFSMFLFITDGFAVSNVCSWKYKVTYDSKTYDISINVAKTTNGLAVSYSNDCAKVFGTGCEEETKYGNSASALEDENVYISASDFALINKKGKCPATAFIDLEAFRNYDKGGKSEVCIGTKSECSKKNNTATYFTKVPDSYAGKMTFTNPSLITGNQGSSSDLGEEPDIIIDSNPTTEDCKGFLGDPSSPNAPAYYLVLAFKIIKYLAIVLVLVMSIIDFVKATISQDKDLLKKATLTAGKRLVFAILIFFLPTLLNYLLSWLGDAYSTCIS